VADLIVEQKAADLDPMVKRAAAEERSWLPGEVIH
jgi:hypothetical protein